jgi:hypothetical protein
MKRSFLSSIILPLIVLAFILSGCEKEEGPIVPKNKPPKIASLTAQPDTLLVNTKTTLVCTASDEDKDALTISWSSTRGTFPQGNVGAKVIWLAPSTAGIDTIFVSVSDGKQVVKAKLAIVVGTSPSIPKLLNPLNGSIEVPLTVKFDWNGGKNTKSYSLQISTEKTFSSFVFSKSGLAKTKRTINDLKSNTTYYWRVRGKNSFGKSRWSKVFSFTTVAPPQAPTLLSPINNEPNVSVAPVLNWKSLFNATSYLLQVSRDDSFSDLVFNQSGLTDTSRQITGLNYFAKYYWRVNATNLYGTSGWSSVSTFTTIGTIPQTPVLIQPINGVKDVPHSVKLCWNKIQFAASYTIQVSDTSTFDRLVSSQSELKDTTFSIDGLSNTKNYFWRVCAVNDLGSSKWSEFWYFTTLLAEPVLTFPKDCADDISPSPIISWNSISEAESYTLQVSSDSLFSNVFYSESGLTSSSQRVSGLSSFTKYYWRVKADNSCSTSSWSTVQSFNVSGYYYKAYPYGTQAVYNPSYVILNGGFDMIQVGNKRDVYHFTWDLAATNIWRNVRDPITPITHYGWWEFITDQVLPFSLNKQNAQFWPNYTLHLIGGGMEYAALKEWYEYHNYPAPQWLSALTVMSYHTINEIIENDRHVGDDVDPIADLYLFDLGGIFFFMNENIKTFFSEDLNLADWSQMPSISLRNGELHNNGQFFSIKWKFPFSDSWHAFYYFGTNGVGGLSYKFKDGTALSVGMGLAAGDLIMVDENKNKKTLGLVGNIGVFYDRNNSLLASLSYTVKTDYMINLNIYPGVVKFGGISPGLWAAYNDDGNLILGFTFSWLPIGVGHSLK